MTLFLSQARRVRPTARLTDADLAHVQAICAFVDGLPLAIELAANWLRMLTAEQILQQLQTGLELLEFPVVDLPERHRNLRVVLEQSWHYLTPRDQEVLAALVVFHGGFTFAAAAAVTGASLRDLQVLVDKSMLSVDVTGRFNRHALIAQLSRQHLDPDHQRQRQLEERHAAFSSSSPARASTRCSMSTGGSRGAPGSKSSTRISWRP
ncbi:hypothetical protein [Deinococcus radiotolerans]|uniref:hypothetical protein n=1 Tax=Deinococcus radiotolerans TaxID=1309407 RepID=UPI0016686EB7|nr:hypothetical protein [Deinococcus radiotolerans]